jgi:hypothetical protein
MLNPIDTIANIADDALKNLTFHLYGLSVLGY